MYFKLILKYRTKISIADYIAWKGRYCAYDYQSFEGFLRYVFAQSMKQPLPSADPWDTNVDVDTLGRSNNISVFGNNICMYI